MAVCIDCYFSFGKGVKIYLMNADGTNFRRLTENGTTDFSPCISPDVTAVAFVSERDINREIYVMDLDGSNQINLTRHNEDDTAPAWLLR